MLEWCLPMNKWPQRCYSVTLVFWVVVRCLLTIPSQKSPSHGLYNKGKQLAITIFTLIDTIIHREN